MGIKDDAVEVRAQGWRTLAALHGLIEAELERSLQAEAQLSVVEYTVLDALSRQDGWHMRMQQLARATALSRQRHHPPGQPARGPRPADPDPVRRRPPRDLHRAHRRAASSCWSRPGPSTTPPWSGHWPRPRRSRNWHRWSTPCRGCTQPSKRRAAGPKLLQKTWAAPSFGRAVAPSRKRLRTNACRRSLKQPTG